MTHFDRAWSALMLGDFDQVILALQCVDGPCRIIREIAESAQKQFGDEAIKWMNLPNISLKGQAPLQVLSKSDVSTWYAVARLLHQPLDLTKLNYPPTL